MWASLLTGRNNHAVSMGELPDTAPKPETPEAQHTSFSGAMPLNSEMLPQALKAVGCRTVGLTKQHLALPDEDGSKEENVYSPLQRGFDDYYGFISGHTDQWHPDLVEGNGPLPLGLGRCYQGWKKEA